MSCSKSHEKNDKPSEDDTATSMEKKVEMAQKFDKEMKDYAKATVKEFLGIYGYEDDVENMSMEENEAPRSSETPVDMTTRNTQSTMSDSSSTKQQDSITNPLSFVLQKSPSHCQTDVIAYQSSGPIAFAVVPVDSLPVDISPPYKNTITEPVPSLFGSESSEDVDEAISEIPELGSSELGRGSSLTISKLNKTSSGSSYKARVTMIDNGTDGDSPIFVDASSPSLDAHGKCSKLDVTSESQLDCSSLSLNHNEQHTVGTTTGLSRKERNRLYKKMSRQRESAEKREVRLARQRQLARERRASEDKDQRGARLIRDRDRQRVKRSREPEEVREQRLIRQRLSARTRRLCETPEQKRARLSADKERSRKYRASKKTQIASMVVTSQG